MAYTDSDLIHEYKHFRAFGFSNERIASRLGYAEARSMLTRLRKLGVDTDPLYVARARKVLDRLADSGERFTSEMLPTFMDPDVGRTLVVGAARSGRIKKVGQVSSVQARFHLVSEYVGVAA